MEIQMLSHVLAPEGQFLADILGYVEGWLLQGVSVLEFSVNRCHMGPDSARNDRRRSAPVVELFNFCPLIRSKIAEFSAHFPVLLSEKIKK